MEPPNRTEAAEMESTGEIVYEKEAALAVEVEAALAEPGEVGGSRVIRYRSRSLSPRHGKFRLPREGGGRLRSRSPLQPDVRRTPSPRRGCSVGV